MPSPRKTRRTVYSVLAVAEPMGVALPCDNHAEAPAVLFGEGKQRLVPPQKMSRVPFGPREEHAQHKGTR